MSQQNCKQFISRDLSRAAPQEKNKVINTIVIMSRDDKNSLFCIDVHDLAEYAIIYRPFIVFGSNLTNSLLYYLIYKGNNTFRITSDGTDVFPINREDLIRYNDARPGENRTTISSQLLGFMSTYTNPELLTLWRTYNNPPSPEAKQNAANAIRAEGLKLSTEDDVVRYYTDTSTLHDRNTMYGLFALDNNIRNGLRYVERTPFQSYQRRFTARETTYRGPPNAAERLRRNLEIAMEEYRTPRTAASSARAPPPPSSARAPPPSSARDASVDSLVSGVENLSLEDIKSEMNEISLRLEAVRIRAPSPSRENVMDALTKRLERLTVLYNTIILSNPNPPRSAYHTPAYNIPASTRRQKARRELDSDDELDREIFRRERLHSSDEESGSDREWEEPDEDDLIEELEHERRGRDLDALRPTRTATYDRKISDIENRTHSNAEKRRMLYNLASEIKEQIIPVEDKHRLRSRIFDIIEHL